MLLSMQFVQLGHWGEPPWLVGPHNGLLSTISTAEAPAFSAWRTFCTKVQSPRSSMMMGSAGHEGSRVMGPQPVAFTPGVPYTTVPVMAPVHAQGAQQAQGGHRMSQKSTQAQAYARTHTHLRMQACQTGPHCAHSHLQAQGAGTRAGKTPPARRTPTHGPDTLQLLPRTRCGSAC